MKKISTLLILVLCLALAACGQANSAPGAQVPVKDGDATSAGAQTSSAKTETTEGLPEDFVEPTSVVEETTPDGGLVAFYLDAIGRPMESIQDFSGYHHEFTYYPSGGTKIWITTDPAGYYSENHYMDNGYVEDGIRHDGWVTYSKTIAPDGLVTEGTYEYSENGNRIEKSTSSDGSYMETRYENEMVTFNSCQFADGSYNENHYESGIQTYSLYKGTDGSYSEYYYENGEKTRYLYKNPNGSSGEERYENGSVTFSSYTHFDGDHNEVHYENGEKTDFIRWIFQLG